jgi:ATP-dependent RNA helicase DOB1
MLHQKPSSDQNLSHFLNCCTVLGKLTDVFEGSIVRVIRRLEELLRQLGCAATAIGNMELKKLFEDGAAKIRRGVVFAASLYL